MKNPRTLLFTWMVCEFLNKVAGSLNTTDQQLPILTTNIDGSYGDYLTEYRQQLHLYREQQKLQHQQQYQQQQQQQEEHENSSSYLYDRYATSSSSSSKSDAAFSSAFIETLSVTLVTEFGDNTFFTSAILAMQHPRIIVFTGALTALTVMNALSVSLSMVMSIIPKIYTYYASTGMLVYFGTRMLRDAYNMSPTKSNGFDAVKDDMEERQKQKQCQHQYDDDDDTTIPTSDMAIESTETSETNDNNNNNNLQLQQQRRQRKRRAFDILLMVFTTVLLAEFGDRSQLTTFVLGTRKNALGVIVGGTVGRTISTASAVIGGRMIAERISIRTVTAIGGILFLTFAFGSTINSSESNLGTVLV